MLMTGLPSESNFGVRLTASGIDGADVKSADGGLAADKKAIIERNRSSVKPGQLAAHQVKASVFRPLVIQRSGRKYR